jgi:DNA polymerase I
MLDTFRQIVAVDFEFEALPGERQVPVCLVAKELRSGRVWRVFQDQFGPAPPYSTGPDTLFVSFYASAEIGCHLALGWPVPLRILDLFCEFRNLTNGLPTPCGSGLVGALVYFGLDALDATTKSEMQHAIGTGTWRGRYTPEEILDYCERDVAPLEQLLSVMLPRIDLPRALLRGRYMAAAARMERNGVPIDVEALDRLRHGWTHIQDALIAEIDHDYGVYDGRTFKTSLFEQWLIRTGIPWPRLESGRLDLSDDTFRQQARAWPAVAPLRELRHALAELRLNDLAVGSDGRNRTILSAFRARTSRNQPSNSRFIFGPSTWIRGLIKPPPGHAVAYIDYSQQEFAIAAVLSGDAAMLAAYGSGDPYLAFAKQAGAIPPAGTKKTHGPARELYKTVALAVLYGMAERGLAFRVNRPPIVAGNLLAAHHQVYRQFWQWCDAAVDHAVVHCVLSTVFGWTVHVAGEFNARSLRNFPMQANGAEMLRLACCLATERGIEVCAPVHDAVLICAPIRRIKADIAATQAAMAEASRIVLGGFELRSEATLVRWPHRYMDGRGKVMWDRVAGLLNATNRKEMTA